MKTWHYATPNNEQFQTNESDLPILVSNGTITPQTRVWSSGMANWAAAGEVMPALFGAAPSSTPPAMPGGGPPPVMGTRSHEIDYEIFGDDMQLVEIELDPGETVIAEAGPIPGSLRSCPPPPPSVRWAATSNG
jgi:hypothetical protein